MALGTLEAARSQAAATSRGVGKVLVVDDDVHNVSALKLLLAHEGYSVCTASNGGDALEVVVREQPDLVLTDVMMPGLNGFEVCREIKHHPATRLTPVVLITGLTDSHDRIQGINAGADDFLTKPVNIEELKARARSLVRLKRYTDDLDSAESVIMSLARTIEARDPYTEGHCIRLASYATALGVQLGLSEEDLAALQRGGFLHDVGKVGIPDAVLHKRARLTPAEFKAMKRHTVIGDRLCGELRSLRSVRPIVRHHHERLDGTGYPDGLKGDDIPLLAQIMSIVDIYDAQPTERPYKSASTPEEAFETLTAEVVNGWRRSDLVSTFIEMARRGDLPRGWAGGPAAAGARLSQPRSTRRPAPGRRQSPARRRPPSRSSRG
jgi:putative two-component system response regulator